MKRLISLLFLCGMVSGCRPREQLGVALPKSHLVPRTHIAVPVPPSVSPMKPAIWVALAAHLGRRISEPPLTLRSEGGELMLRDGSGKIWRSPSLSITWRFVKSDASELLARIVAGPFSSFESAEYVANQWRKVGVEAVVAHPEEWEVWAPVGSLVPDGLEVRDWSGLVDLSIEPFLEYENKTEQLEGPLFIEASKGLRWGDGVYQGPFRLQRDAYGSWTLVEEAPLERYLMGVVPHEIGASSPAAALKAQSVLARTWALANSHRFLIDGYHLCNNTQCQVYRDPQKASKAVINAISATKGRFLSWEGRPINAVYHASNGGVMADGSEAWSMDLVPYLRAALDGDMGFQSRHALPLQHKDAVQKLLSEGAGIYGNRHPLFRWQRIMKSSEIIKSLGVYGEFLQSPLTLKVVERGMSGRVLKLQISGSGNKREVVLRLDKIRSTFKNLPSTLFLIESLGSQTWLFQGGGFGHGAGLSQAGAINLAIRGWSSEEILSHYYPGTVYGKLSVKKSSL